jgi:hypothetical protein
MTSLLDIQQYCNEGTFPPRKAKQYGNLTTFIICFHTNGTPRRDVQMSPDGCRTVTELKDLIQAYTREWYGESFLLNVATLEVEDKPKVESAKLIKFSIENDEEWQHWRERNLVNGRQAILKITVWLDAKRNPGLGRVASAVPAT